MFFVHRHVFEALKLDRDIIVLKFPVFHVLAHCRTSSLSEIVSVSKDTIRPSCVSAHITSLNRSISELNSMQNEHVNRLLEAQKNVKLRSEEASNLRLQISQLKTEVCL